MAKYYPNQRKKTTDWHHNVSLSHNEFTHRGPVTGSDYLNQCGFLVTQKLMNKTKLSKKIKSRKCIWKCRPQNVGRFILAAKESMNRYRFSGSAVSHGSAKTLSSAGSILVFTTYIRGNGCQNFVPVHTLDVIWYVFFEELAQRNALLTFHAVILSHNSYICFVLLSSSNRKYELLPIV